MTITGISLAGGPPNGFPPAASLNSGDLIYMAQAGSEVAATVAQMRAALVVNPTRETFVAGTDFAAGTSTSITLAGTYGSIASILVSFDNALQFDCSLSGRVLTFNPVVPGDVQKIYVVGGVMNSIGTPGVGTVGPSQFAFPVSGTTPARPTPFFIGQPYFDTTLGTPIWASQLSPSVKWVNASGFPV